MRALLFLILLLLTVWILELGQLVEGQPDIGLLFPDSNQYLQYASELIGEPFVALGSDQDFLSGSLVRQPMYPALIGGFSFFWGHISPHSILITHTAIALALLIYAYRIMTPRLFIFLWSLILPAWAVLSIYRESLMTEWLVFHLLLFLFLSVIKFIEERSRLSLIAVSLFSGVLVLTRFEFLPVLILPFLLASPKIKYYFLQALIGTFLVSCAVIPQFIYHGRFTWGDLSKAGTFALVSGLGVIEESSNPEISDLSKVLSKEGKVISTAEIVPIIWFNTDSLFEALSVNDRVARKIKEENKLSWQDLYEVEGAYAREMINKFPLKYLILVASGMGTIIWIVPFAIAVYLSSKDRGDSAIWTGVVTLIGIHIVRTLSISFINIPYIRYYAPTFAAVVVASLLLIVGNNFELAANNKGEKGKCS